jgi:uncharacterized protein DUF1496
MKFSRIILACSIALAASLELSTPLHAQNARVCLYASKTYSEGASICVGRSLMISCSTAGERMVWTTVADQDTARVCAPQAGWRSYTRPLRASFRRAQPAARPVADAARPVADTAKCFNFNGRKYCE